MEIIEIYERIESVRKKHKISQGKLERELGFSNGSISKWKTSMPNSKRLQKLADYFNVSTDYLLDRTDCKSVDNQYISDVTGLSEKSIKHLMHINNLPDKGQINALNILLSSPLIVFISSYLHNFFFCDYDSMFGYNKAAKEYIPVNTSGGTCGDNIIVGKKSRDGKTWVSLNTMSYSIIETDALMNISDLLKKIRDKFRKNK